MLSAFIVMGWTAFEALAADLWEAALNQHPAGLSTLSESPKRLRKGAKNRSYQAKDEEHSELKHVPLNLMQKYGYDLSNSMGSILRDRFSFERLDGIREAYGSAFPKFDKIDDPLTDNALDALATVRNVIVHRAGIADQEYCRRIERLKIPKVDIGAALLLDGEVVEQLVGNTLDRAIDLFSGVDEWLSAN